MYISKMSLPRRTFLRGMGAAIALPFLDAMVPALTPLARLKAAGATPGLRFGAIYIPNGAIVDEFFPKASGTGFEFTPILKPLEPFKNSLVVVKNLTRSHPGSQVGDHAVSVGGYLTGRLAEADRSRGRAGEHDDRSGRGQADRPGHAAPVARSRDGRLHRLCRRLLAGVQLRVPQHDLVEARRPRRCRWRSIRAWCSSGCSARPGPRRTARRAPAAEEHARLDFRRRPADLAERAGRARPRRASSEYLDNIREIERRIQKAEAHNTSQVTASARRSACPTRSRITSG